MCYRREREELSVFSSHFYTATLQTGRYTYVRTYSCIYVHVGIWHMAAEEEEEEKNGEMKKNHLGLLSHSAIG